MLTSEKERVRLAPFSFWAAGLWFRLAGDPRVRQFLGEVQGPGAQIASFHRDLKGRRFVRVVRYGPRRVGLVYLVPTKNPDQVELSYLFLPEVWGQGVATQAIDMVLSSASCQIVAETQTANFSSCKMLERLGFQRKTRLQKFGAEQSIYVRAAPQSRE